MSGFLAEAIAFIVGGKAIDAAEQRWPRAVAIGLPVATVAMFVLLFVWAAAEKGDVR